MLEMLLCCSPVDHELAATIAARLENNVEATVALDGSETGTVAVKWEGGISSAAILLLLSPEAVPPQVSRTSWGTLLDHIASNAGPPVFSILVRDCGYPRILERKHFFRWQEGPREGLRAIEKWTLELDQPRQPSFLPARLPWFEGREDELELLWTALVDRSGAAVIVNPEAASGKTSLAQEFSRQAAAHFRDILWVACGDRSPASIALNLAEQIGGGCRPHAGETLAGLIDLAGKHRVLVVLDDLQPPLAIPDRHGRASVLVTTRSARIEAPPAVQVIRIGKPPDVPVAPPSDPVDLRLWRAMAVCRPAAFPLELAARIAGVEAAPAQAAGARLIEARLAAPIDSSGDWLRIGASSVAAAGDSLEIERRHHAEIVHELISGWAKKPDFTKRYTAEFIPAFRWAAGANWPLAAGIARHSFAFLRHHGRLAEGAELLAALRDAADTRSDWQVSDECSWELSWIRGLPYRGAARAPVDGDQLDFDFG